MIKHQTNLINLRLIEKKIKTRLFATTVSRNIITFEIVPNLKRI